MQAQTAFPEERKSQHQSLRRRAQRAPWPSWEDQFSSCRKSLACELDSRSSSAESFHEPFLNDELTFKFVFKFGFWFEVRTWINLPLVWTSFEVPHLLFGFSFCLEETMKLWPNSCQLLHFIYNLHYQILPLTSLLLKGPFSPHKPPFLLY